MSSEDAPIFNASTHLHTNKRSLKLRPSVLTSPAHIMNPTNSNTPWTLCEMPSWAGMQSNSVGVMEFRGDYSNTTLCKRKADDVPFIKPKKLITEEKMAEHLSGLHISSDFTSHSSSTLEDYSSDSVSMDSDCSMSLNDYNIPSSQDLEQKIRNAQRITICEQIRKLRNEPAIPQAILSRFERPCTAMVLWQPPQKILPVSSSHDRKSDDNDEQDNNNSLSIDLNTSMELDL